MGSSQQQRSSRKHRGRWLLALVFTMYLAQVVLAQESPSAETPTAPATDTLVAATASIEAPTLPPVEAVPVTATPLEATFVTAEPTFPPLEIVLPTASLIPPSPTLPPLESPLPTEETIPPASTLPPLGNPDTGLLPENTLPPPLLTVEASAEQLASGTPALILPPSVLHLTVNPNTVNFPEGQRLVLTIFADSLLNAHSVAVTCEVDPAALQGVQALPGTLLPRDQVMSLNSGFQSDGRWTLIATSNNAAPDLLGTGSLWELTYSILSQGTIPFRCQTIMADAAGTSLPAITINGEIVVEHVQATDAAALLDAAPEIIPTAEILPPSDHLQPQPDTVSPPPQIEASRTSEPAPPDLDVPVSEAVMVQLITMNYGQTSPPASPSLDLNGDRIIDIRDLVIASGQQHLP